MAIAIAASSHAAQDSSTTTPKPSAKKSQTPPSVFEVCKRAAAGISGPKRSKFMTKCIKDKKNG